MSEEAVKPKKKRLLYYIVLAVCVLLLIAATVLTVYFLTAGSTSTLEDPSDDQTGGETPGGVVFSEMGVFWTGRATIRKAHTLPPASEFGSGRATRVWSRPSEP